MSEKYELRISLMGGAEPVVTFFGDSRGSTATDKLLLTSLDGWDAPVYMSRISIPDPNGGSYVDKHARPEQKLVTANWSIFASTGYKGWQLRQSLKPLSHIETFMKLTLITTFDDGTKVTEVLDDCYMVSAPTHEKHPGEDRYVMVLGSKNYEFSSSTVVLPVTEPQPGEEGYQGQTDGEVGVGLQAGKVWNSSTQTWDTPPPQPGEEGYEGQTDGEAGVGLQAGKYWQTSTQSWKAPGEEGYQGRTDGEAGTGAQSGYTWNESLQAWEQNAPPEPGEEGYEGTYNGEPGVGLQAGKYWQTGQGWFAPGDPNYRGRSDGEVGVGAQEGQEWDADFGMWMDVPQPGEPGYTGKYDGEVGVGEQSGYAWSESMQAWMPYSPPAQQGEEGYQGTYDGEVGIGAQEGYTWNSAWGAWVQN